jgi:hypothetical protein
MPSPSRRGRGGGDRNAPKKVQAPSVRAVRESARRISRVSDLYGAGETGRLLDSRFTRSAKVSKLLQRRHKHVFRGIDDQGVYRYRSHAWKVPGGVRLCLKRPLVYGQIVNQYPWAVVWTSPSTGRRKRKLFATPLSAIHFIATKAQYVDRQSAVISRCVGYDIPLRYVNKIPRPWRWCPYCMTARKFRRRSNGDTFYAQRKEWSEEKGRYVWHERKLAVLECTRCGSTNQDIHMRRSNQPWEVNRIKPGARRVRRK